MELVLITVDIEVRGLQALEHLKHIAFILFGVVAEHQDIVQVHNVGDVYEPYKRLVDIRLERRRRVD